MLLNWFENRLSKYYVFAAVFIMVQKCVTEIVCFIYITWSLLLLDPYWIFLGGEGSKKYGIKMKQMKIEISKEKENNHLFHNMVVLSFKAKV